MNLRCLALLGAMASYFFMADESQAQFSHVTTSQNTKEHITTLKARRLNNKPNLLVFVSQVYGQYNAHQIGVWYSEGRWTIFNQDRTPLPLDTTFNVMSFNAGKRVPAFRHRVTTDNTLSDYPSTTKLDNPLTNGKPKAVLLVTSNYVDAYDNHPIGVWYTDGHWTIFHQDEQPMTVGLEYNVLVLSPKVKNNKVRKAMVHTVDQSNIDQEMNWISTLPDMDPNSLPMFTQRWDDPEGVYNTHIPGLWLNEGRWSIFNQDRVAMPLSAKFNVVEFGKK